MRLNNGFLEGLPAVPPVVLRVFTELSACSSRAGCGQAPFGLQCVFQAYDPRRASDSLSHVRNLDSEMKGLGTVSRGEWTKACGF